MIINDKKFIKDTFEKIINMPRNHKKVLKKSKSSLFNKISSNIEFDNSCLNSYHLFKFLNNNK